MGFSARSAEEQRSAYMKEGVLLMSQTLYLGKDIK